MKTQCTIQSVSRHTHETNPVAARQRGAALIVSLILMLAMTIIGVASMRTTNVQERVTANYYDRALAFQNVDSALREGEVEAVMKYDPSNEGDMSAWFYTGDPTRMASLTQARWLLAATRKAVTPPSVSGYKGPPLDAGTVTDYIIETFRTPSPGMVGRGAGASGYEQTKNIRFRVTARQTVPATSGRASTVLQSIAVQGVPRS